jgi:hypothetical protein
MLNKYSVGFADGYYITKNGIGILDLVNPDDGEFANYLVTLLENAERKKRKAAQQSVRLTKKRTTAKSDNESKPAVGWLLNKESCK